MTECKDAQGSLNGKFCRHCMKLILTLECWAEMGNDKARTCLLAERKARKALRMFLEGTN